MADEIFSGIEEAQVFEGGTYLTDGVYPDLEVLKVVSYKNRKGIGGFRVELKVIESVGEKALSPGTQCAYITTKNQEGFLGNVKGILQKLATEMSFNQGGGVVPVDQVDKAFAEMAVSEAQPLKGLHLKAQAQTILTKGKGLPFTKIEFSPKSAAPARA